VIDITGDKKINRYTDLTITVRPQDNIGISKVMLYFNEESNGNVMKNNFDGTYSLEVDRVDLENLAGCAGESLIQYHVEVMDSNNNKIRSPKVGHYTVEIRDVEENDDPVDNKEEQTGPPMSFYVNIAAMIIIILVVAVVLFMFIRRQSEDIYKDRHKLRMALADVSEGVSADKAAPSVPLKPSSTEVDDITFLPGTTLTGESVQSGAAVPTPVIDTAPAALSSSPQTTAGKASPAGYLPPASGPFPPTNSNELRYDDVSEYRDTSVEVDGGLFVSLPEGSQNKGPKPDLPSTKPVPKPSSSQNLENSVDADGDNNFWKPPKSSKVFEHKEN
jgi:hypothetical protein